jgi:hypothetical protein
MEENSMPRRLMYMQPEGPRKVGRPRARWRDDVGKGSKDAGSKELERNNHESRRMEETSLGGQESLRVVAPMMIMMTFIINSK